MITAAVTAVFLPMCENAVWNSDGRKAARAFKRRSARSRPACAACSGNESAFARRRAACRRSLPRRRRQRLCSPGSARFITTSARPPRLSILSKTSWAKIRTTDSKPSQSAKIIISHVTYGTKLAKEMGLPQRIVDFIPQHHGTRTLHYFLKKAQAEARTDEEISENDFRYPGPKPQFKEAAIMMIADSCEAAAAALPSRRRKIFASSSQRSSTRSLRTISSTNAT